MSTKKRLGYKYIISNVISQIYTSKSSNYLFNTLVFDATIRDNIICI